MRRQVIVIAVLALLAVPPAAAGEPETELPVTPPPRSLTGLITLVESQIAALSIEPPFGSEDRVAREAAVLARIDVFIGSVRSAAIRYVDAFVPEPGRSVINDLPSDIEPVDVVHAVEEVESDPVAIWTAEKAGIELLRLRQAIDRLRALVAGSTPERVCPVKADTWFEDNWGDDRPGGRSHKGIDLHGERGVPVQAIEDGVVVQANWHWQGGRQIYFRADSTGDVYYYAHLDYWAKWIWTGTRVEAGDVIGLLGSSGNADSPHLHFGWMPASGGVDLENLQNPYPLLLEICR